MNKMTFVFASFFESSFKFRSNDDLSRFENNLFRVRKSSVIRNKERSRKSMNRQKQFFKQFSQRKRFDFEMMKKTFNLNSIEASQMLLRRRNRSSERKKREEYRDARDDARDETNVLMKNFFSNIFQITNE